MSDTAPLPPALKAKIAPLLRLQSSTNDGERANASAAIGRLLKNHGLDWHDLTNALLAEPPPTPPPPPPPQGTTWKRSTGAIELTREHLLELLDLVEARTPFLSLKSRSFLTSLCDRSWRPRIRLSEKQWAWFQDLIETTGV